MKSSSIRYIFYVSTNQKNSRMIWKYKKATMFDRFKLDVVILARISALFRSYWSFRIRVSAFSNWWLRLESKITPPSIWISRCVRMTSVYLSDSRFAPQSATLHNIWPLRSDTRRKQSWWNRCPHGCAATIFPADKTNVVGAISGCWHSQHDGK